MQSIFHHRATRANLTNCLQSHKNKQFAQTYKEWNRIGVTYSRSFSPFWVTRHCEYVNSEASEGIRRDQRYIPESTIRDISLALSWASPFKSQECPRSSGTEVFHA